MTLQTVCATQSADQLRYLPFLIVEMASTLPFAHNHLASVAHLTLAGPFKALLHQKAAPTVDPDYNHPPLMIEVIHYTPTHSKRL